MFDKIKKWYKQGLWTAEMIEQAVAKGVLTQEKLAQIVNSEEG